MSNQMDALATDSWLAIYQREAFDALNGWVAPGAIPLLGAVDTIQRWLGATGGVMEIGIFQGRFFIALNGLVESTDRSLAIDLFAEQEMNIDGSGRGDRAVFEANLARFDRHGGHNVTILQADSTTLVPGDVLDRIARPRLVSIDGGHTPEHTLSDLRLAGAVVHPRGAVFVDDVLNANWLGVMEGIATFLQAKPTLWPVAIGHNKLVMVGMSWHSAYLEALAAQVSFRKRLRFFGYELLTL